MTLTEKIFVLRATPCFDGLLDGDLALIADVAHGRDYAPGETICEAGQRLKKFMIVIRGAVEDDAGRRMPALLGAGSLLLDVPAPKDLRASPGEGAVCLCINKGHFFTIAYQFPSIVCRLIEINPADGSASVHPEAAP